MIPASCLVCLVHACDTPALLGGRISSLAADADDVADTVIHHGEVCFKRLAVLRMQLVDSLVDSIQTGIHSVQALIYGIKALVYGIKPIIYCLKRLKNLLDQRIRYPLGDSF